MQKNETLIHSAERDILQIAKWNKVLGKSIWILFFILFLLEGIITAFYCMGVTLDGGFGNYEYIMSYFIKPCLTILITILVLKSIERILAGRYGPNVQAWVVIFTIISMATEVIIFHHGISVIYVAYGIPITASLVYNQQRLLFFTYLVSIALYFLVLLYIVYTIPQEQYHHNYMDAAGTVAILTAVYSICRMILSRIQELIKTAVNETRLRMKLSHEVSLDSLTQLYNHATFYQRLDALIIDSRQDESKEFALILMDIDNFKAINDTFGHDVGDEVILRLVDTINNQMNPGDLAFRYGGEEFAILTTDIDHAEELAEAVRENFANQVYSSTSLKTTISIGVSAYSDTYGGKREFFSSVDKALYRAKHAGKNCVCVAQ